MILNGPFFSSGWRITTRGHWKTKASLYPRSLLSNLTWLYYYTVFINIVLLFQEPFVQRVVNNFLKDIKKYLIDSNHSYSLNLLLQYHCLPLTISCKLLYRALLFKNDRNQIDPLPEITNKTKRSKTYDTISGNEYSNPGEMGVKQDTKTAQLIALR